MFENVPYLWGGRTQLGLDCSGLMQTAFQACGRPCPRDTDMMERALGEALPFGDTGVLERGDLVFWAGHVGMMVDGQRLIHANGHHMLTVIEPLSEALSRIAALFGQATSYRRP
jgi:cell wall-associated NlpC family hydrolase